MAKVTATRTLHLIDLENLLGDDRLHEPDAGAALERYLHLARWRLGDHVIVAAHPALVARFAFTPPVACNVHAVNGPDAADVMLLSCAPPELVERRYGRLVIGSGDGIFTGRAREVRDRGIGVAIVARRERCSSRFRSWGFPVIEFDDQPVTLDLLAEELREQLRPVAA